MISLMEAAGRRPSVRRAGLLGSTPTNTIVGRPCICTRHVIITALPDDKAELADGAGESSRQVCMARELCIPCNVSRSQPCHA